VRSGRGCDHLDHYGLNPYGLERPVYDELDGRYHLSDDQIIDRIKERFPPDNFFSLLGTTGDQIGKGLTDVGLQTHVAYSVNPSDGREIREDVKRWTNQGFPVIIIVDRGKLGGRPLTARWGVVYKVADSQAYSANSKGTPAVPEARFLRAFHSSYARQVQPLRSVQSTRMTMVHRVCSSGATR
jgi:hypothetical protein